VLRVACVRVLMLLKHSYAVASTQRDESWRTKGLLVLETIFSYPTRSGEELLHKNTSIRERDGQRGERGGGGGEEDKRGDRQREWGRDGELVLFH